MIAAQNWVLVLWCSNGDWIHEGMVLRFLFWFIWFVGYNDDVFCYVGEVIVVFEVFLGMFELVMVYSNLL